MVANLDHFGAVLGGDVSLAYCLSTASWRSFADVVVFGEERGLFVGVNLVSEPARLSLWRAPATLLDKVAAVWTAQSGGVASRLVRNRQSWSDNVAWIVGAAAEARAEAETHVTVRSSDLADRCDALARAHADGGPIVEIEIDAEDRIVTIGDVEGLRQVGIDIDPGHHLGRPVMALLSGPIADRFGADFSVALADKELRRIRLLTMTFNGPDPGIGAGRIDRTR